MKLNKILSSLLVFVMLFTGIFTVLPVGSLAATAPVVSVNGNATLENEQIKEIVNEYFEYNYSTAEEMLAAEKALGYLDSVTNGDFKIYVNRYTGLVYYVNTRTGQILTSNPIDPGYRKNLGQNNLSIVSQVEISYMDLATNDTNTYYSLDWIINGSQMSVEAMDNGLRAIYYLGEIDDRFFTPASVMSEDFEAHISDPLFEAFATLIAQHCDETRFDIESKSGVRENNDPEKPYKLSKVTDYIDEVVADVKDEIGNGTAYNAIYKFGDAIKTIFNSYSVIDISKYNPDTATGSESIKNYLEQVPGCANGPVYKLKNVESVATLRVCHRVIKQYCKSYTPEMVAADEAKAGYAPAQLITPSFKVCVEYTLDNDGNFIVTVPVNAMDFDDSAYTVSSLKVLKYFGAGDMNNDGYVFFPDGSGAILEFEDFYTPDDIKGDNVTNSRINLTSEMYGKDYCYSEITGAHREQIIMPVYGIVNDVKANGVTETLTGSGEAANGFFAIIEDGSSLASLLIETGGATHKYATTYPSFTPFPMDKYDISESVSASGSGYYYVVSNSPYQGSFVTRYTMLADEAAAEAANLEDGEYFLSDYVGMAQCYREYLKNNGTISAISEASEDLPLYIEALGSIDIMQRILSFPVTVSVPLTTFDDVYTMYEELSNAKATLADKAEEYRALAEATAEDEADLKAQYLEKAAKYDELSEKVQNITNINFRLTGFANGGMYFTYPTKVNWENSVGGYNGFVSLIGKAAEESKKDGHTFGVYPDFDFAYINNTAMFDGISERGTAACMVDNRYASKQLYNSVVRKYESIYALVVSPDSYERLYDTFNGQYSGYSWDQLSVSTLGSDLNSNFYEDNPLHREGSLDSIVSLLDKMTTVSNYRLMTDVGNVYAVKYAEHILNATIDSSHFRYSSYAIPFYGLVFHGYVSYAGSPINYSGDPDYDILRSIENGASLYYVLCMQNTNYLKNDEMLSKYYGVDYKNWFDKLVDQYTTLNGEIGDLQQYEIVDHRIVLSERVIDEAEKAQNYKNLIAELISAIDSSIYDAIVAKQDEMSGDVNYIGKGLKVEFERADLMQYADELINLTTDELKADFAADLDKVLDKYSAEFSGDGYLDPVKLTFNSSDVSYRSIYNYVTDSVATAGDRYVYTDFTCDNGNVVMVTYEDPKTGDKVVFLLNYNAFSVDIIIDNTVNPSLSDGETEKITLKPYGYYRMGREG